MGKCIFSGYETNNQLEIDGKNYFVAEEVQTLMELVLNGETKEDRIGAYNTLLSYEETFDETNFQAIKSEFSYLEGNISNPNYKRITSKKIEENNEVIGDFEHVTQVNFDDIEPIANEYGKKAYFIKRLIAIFSIILGISCVAIGITSCILVSIAIGVVVTILGPIIVWLMYMLDMVLVEACINIAYQRAISESTNQMIAKMLKEKEENEK